MQNPAEENIVKLSDFQKWVRQMPSTYDPKDITQRSRILERPAFLHQRFFNDWIPMEHLYFEKCHTCGDDVVIL